MGSLLAIFVSPGCPACAVAEPEFERYKTRNPMQLALRFDASGPYVERYGLKRIRETPTYLLRVDEQNIAVAAGAMRAKDLERWVKGNLAEVQ